MNVKVLSALMPFRTHHFNEGQRVWLAQVGSGAAEVVGRFRNRGDFVRIWINWGHCGRPIPKFEMVDADAMFVGRYGIARKP